MSIFSGGSQTGAIGISDLPQMENVDLWWGDLTHQVFSLGNNEFYKDAQDAGNTDGSNSYPSHLRMGLLLGRRRTDNLWAQWNPLANDGTETILGILAAPLMLAPYHGATTAGQRAKRIMIGGWLQLESLIIPGQTNRGLSGQDYEFMVANALAGNFTLGRNAEYRKPGATGNLTTSRTLTTSEHNTTFSNYGAAGTVTATLPAPKLGLRYEFHRDAAQTLTVAGATATDIVDHEAATTSVSVSVAAGTKLILEGVRVAGATKFQSLVI